MEIIENESAAAEKEFDDLPAKALTEAEMKDLAEKRKANDVVIEQEPIKEEPDSSEKVEEVKEEQASAEQASTDKPAANDELD